MDCRGITAILIVKSNTGTAAISRHRTWQRIARELNESEVVFSLKSVADSIQIKVSVSAKYLDTVSVVGMFSLNDQLLPYLNVYLYRVIGLGVI